MNIWPIVIGIAAIALVAGVVALMLGSAGDRSGSETIADGYARLLIAGGALIWVGVFGFGAWFLFALFSSVSSTF